MLIKSKRPDLSGDSPDKAARRDMMATLAKGRDEELASGLEAAGLADYPVTEVRPPEVGLVMVRGRQGGDGAPFNLGEATVTRAAVQAADGVIGVAHLLGRVPRKARLAALIDALWQQSDHRQAIETHVLQPIRARTEAEERKRRAESAATTVDFFTMVRGDD